MILKKLAIAIIALTFSMNLMANEETAQQSEAVDKCEAAYSECLSICDSKGDTNVEQCYDVCDEKYSKCVEETQSN